jgi:hypothetical protein
MSTYVEAKHPRGKNPDNVGQYSPKDYAEPEDVELDDARRTSGIAADSVFDMNVVHMRPGAFILGQVCPTTDARFGARLAQHTMVSQFLGQVLHDPVEAEALADSAERHGKTLTAVRSTPMGSLELVSGPVKSIEGRDGQRLRYISNEMLGSTWLGNAEDMNDGVGVLIVSKDTRITDAKATAYQDALRDRIANYPLDFPTLEPSSGEPGEALPAGQAGKSAYVVTAFDRGRRGNAEVFIPERLVVQRGEEYYEGQAYGNGSASTKKYRPEYLQRYAGHIQGFDPNRAHVDRWAEATEEDDDTAIWAAAGGNPPAEWELETRAS